ncbi:MAG TPA: ScyD/ScyE family protein [Mycobacteriales bacterium]|nr:ScyD/ScyE family protein [Mycobacteriales bacterium]
MPCFSVTDIRKVSTLGGVGDKVRIIRSKGGAAVAVTTAALIPFAASPAFANAPNNHGHSLHVIKTLSSNFVGPLQFAVSGRNVFVADSFTSTLNLIGRSAPLATGPDPSTGGDLAGVAVDPHSRALAYTSSNGDHSSTKLTILQHGRRPVVADLSGFEKRHNPDGRVQYGVRHPSKCVSDALAAQDVPASYRGTLDSHPYSVTPIGHGAWAVADAGANDIVRVDRHGHVSLISVLPSQPVKISAAFAAANKLPDCVIGVTYKFEPVPTDVETGPRGRLYVTTLPGGPEGPEGGNPGSVYTIDRWGTAHRIATGFAGATNLAIDNRGTIYVAEISAGRLSTIWHGQPKPVLSLPGVVAVEYANGHLYASTAPAAAGAEGPGTVVLLGR